MKKPKNPKKSKNQKTKKNMMKKPGFFHLGERKP
jgi:hypothetical protein